MKIELLQIIYLIALAIFVIGIKMTVATKRGSLIAATGLSIGIVGTIFLFRDHEAETIVLYPWLLGVLILGFVLGWVLALKSKPAPAAVMVSLLYALAGCCAILMVVYELAYIVDSGLVFPADTEEDLPGFVFIFGKFGHLEIFLMVVGLIIGTASFAGSVVAWAKLTGKIKDRKFKWQKWVDMVLVVLLLGYAGFIVYNTPIMISSYGFTPTTTDGTRAYSGLYDMHKMLLYSIAPLTLLCSFMLAMPISGTVVIFRISVLIALGGVAMMVVGFVNSDMSFIAAGATIIVAGILLALQMKQHRAKGESIDE
ncbi:MAG: NAD(P)(+) transhydrogenase (Re/Si-specific) subunit beta [Bacteroidota bacterium]